MTEPSVSVVIVSYDRPDELARCLKALTFQHRRRFEIIVVCNEGSEPGLEATGLGEEIKTASFDRPNISAARNIGIGLAAGDIVAFIDDDAIAEPTWLRRLIEPFQDDQVTASGGLVVGRNGFSVQWSGEEVDKLGSPTPLDIRQTEVFSSVPYRFIKTHGTNCAFRRSVLAEMGGFDEAFHYFLDETDLNIRIGKAGKSVAIVPGAIVQHETSESEKRLRSRAPKSLYEVGASVGYFGTKYGLGNQALRGFRADQEMRLQKMIIHGWLEPRDFKSLMRSFEDGVLDGKTRIGKNDTLTHRAASDFMEFRPYQSKKEHIYFSCRRLNSGASKEKARSLAASGMALTLFVFSWTIWRHRRFFHRDGYWVQKGGLFGMSLRNQPVFRISTLSKRTSEEIRDLEDLRGPASSHGQT